MSGPIRVLHVDDQGEFADLTADALEREDDRFSVVTASDADEALDLLDEDVDCVVSDYEMPGANGIELLRTVRAADPDLPFVLFTGKGSEEVASEAFAAGATDYLQKRSGTEQYELLANRILSAVDRYRSRRERERRERTMERYETILEALGDPVYAIDEDGCYTFVNEAFTEMTGYDEAELLGEHTSTVVPEEAVEKGIELTRELLRAGEGATRTCELEIVTASGERIACENNIALLPFDGDEGFRGTAGVIREITARKERERRLERQNERLEEFASVVSHDLRNPLSVAEGHVELAREECDSDHLDTAARAHERMGALIDDLLVLAREGEGGGDPGPVDLAAVADDCWRNVATAEATLVVETDRTVRADESRLRQLIENLVRNAVEHGSTTPTDTADPTERADAVTVTIGDLDDGFYVADDGPGIPPDRRERVFEAGYTTSADGTGFGLRIVADIAEAHDWAVEVTESEAGGARFEITGVTFAE